MEFWGVEVKCGESLKVQPEFGKLIHISQAALGEIKDAKSAKYVPLRLKVDDKKFVIGSLSAEDRTQLMFDLVFEKEFELSHDWKNGSVYFIGYMADEPVSDGEEFSDGFGDESEEELVGAEENGDIKAKLEAGKPGKNAAAKDVTKKEEQLAIKEDEDDGESDSDDEMDENDDSEDSEDDADEDSDEEEEELPKKSKKRSAEPAQETPVPSKKAKASTPDKTGNKKGHVATPFPSKAGGKYAAGNKAKEQTPKSSSGQNSCKSCNKTFTSPAALQSHTKAKHGGK